MSFDIEANGKFDNASFSLNPFGTGQCLSTNLINKIESNPIVSIPLEQGNVFRL